MAFPRQCPKGHYWDPDMYPSCPICGNLTDSVDRTAGATTATVPADREDRVQTISVGRTIPATQPVFPPDRPGPEDEDNGHTIAAPVFGQFVKDKQESADVQPTVGWVVCTAGAYLGQSFTLHAGNNYVGRSHSAEVCLSKDMQVSEHKHIKLTYEPRANRYFITPGDSTNLVYLNDQALLQAAQLAAYDRIDVGESSLCFIPLCSEHFTWDKMKKG